VIRDGYLDERRKRKFHAKGAKKFANAQRKPLTLEQLTFDTHEFAQYHHSPRHNHRRPLYSMSLLQAIILGLVQGLTEFIPISSTAHLTLAGKWMGLIDPQHPEQWTAFIAVIQLGTLAAVIIYFWRDIINITAGFVLSVLGQARKQAVPSETNRHAKLGWLIIVGTIPVGLVGLLFRHRIEGALTKDLRIIAGSLIGLAIVLTIAEIAGRRSRDMDRLRFSDAIIVGIAQVFALIPGSSRSGSTIAGGLFAGLTRETAARFSFLLSIPAIAASGLFELPKALHSVNASLSSIVVASVVSGITGYLSIAFLLRYLQRHATYLFVVYRILLGVLLIVLITSGRIAP